MNALDELIGTLSNDKALIKAVLAHPVKGSPLVRVTVRPLSIKGKERLQITEEYSTKVLHKNISWDQVPSVLKFYFHETFREGHFFTTTGDYHFLKGKSGEWKVIKKKATHLPTIQEHNRPKQYLIDPASPFWKQLDVVGKNGEIKSTMRSKFRQVERFLEIAEDLLKKLPETRLLRVVDFGCGKSYLTFALAEHLKNKGQPFQILGVDLKEEVVVHLNQIAEALGYSSLKFIAGSIQDCAIEQEVDLVISLHACDTATDELLAKAVKAKAKGILSVPCCQHELLKQITQPLLDPLLKYGILKERFSALVTDACRAELLEQSGYRTQILEFIDTEHTPKNLLIRALRREKQSLKNEQLSSFFHFLKIKPKLSELLKYDDP